MGLMLASALIARSPILLGRVSWAEASFGAPQPVLLRWQ